MIHMSQVKVPVEDLIHNAPAELVKRGIIGPEERLLVKRTVAKLLRIMPEEIRELKILRKSTDARKKQNIVMIYQVEFRATQERVLVKRYGKNDGKWVSDREGSEVGEKNIPCKKGTGNSQTFQKNGAKTPPPVIVGAGPAGLFAALTLARAGLAPYIVERGQQVEERQKSVDIFWKTGRLNPESNVQFGEGGAGTFSDGKLNTLVKDKTGRNGQVLRTFVEFGAPGEILYLNKPHIGTDILKEVVRNIRQEIIRLGGRFSFETKLTDIGIEDGNLNRVTLDSGGRQWTQSCRQLILATGHSARDTFTQLYERGVMMEAKAFAVGVRVEHRQTMIGKSQYGAYYDALPAADYKLTYQAESGRGVYSFCMCPGGYVVNASSEEGRLAVNGMSYYDRAGENANSAIIVTVTPDDFGESGALAGIAFQRKYEELAYCQAAGKIPVQLYGDFVQNKKSTTFGSFVPAMKGAYELTNVRGILPKMVGDAMIEAMQAFGKKICGYDGEDTIISGIESRTSSPVRIVRDQTLQGNIRGLYPCGEGAGYAGGIMSAAMDGIRVAEQIINTKA